MATEHSGPKGDSSGGAPLPPADARLERLMQSLRRYRPEDEPALRRFQRRVFGAEARQLEPERFRWLFADNPWADPAETELWICERGEIVGQQSGILHRLRVGEEEFRASWAVDLMVDPPWRLRGVGPALSERHARSHPIVVAVGATDLLYPVLRRTGWTDLGHIPLYARPLRMEPLGPWWEHRRARRRLWSSLGRPLIPAADRWCELEIRRAGLRLEPIAAADERIDEVWRLASPDYPALARRDAEALRWRFDRGPDAMRYRRFLVVRSGRPVGYLVLREGVLLQVPVTLVIDFLCPRGLTAPLLALSVQEARQAPSAAVICETMHLRAAGAFPRTGFVRVPRRTPRRFLWRTQPELSRLHATLNGREAWFVTRADGDWDHPDPIAESLE